MSHIDDQGLRYKDFTNFNHTHASDVIYLSQNKKNILCFMYM